MASFEEIIRMKGEAQEANTAAAQAVGELQSKILMGEDTTGDFLTDGVVALHGKDVLRPEYLQAYRKLDQALKGKAGEPVLLIEFWHGNPQGCTGFGGKATYEKNRTFELGVLGRDSLVFDLNEKRCLLPTLRHSKHESRERNYTVHDGPISTAGGQHLLHWRDLVYSQAIMEITDEPRQREQLIKLFLEGLRDSNVHSRMVILAGTDRIKQLIEGFPFTGLEPTLRRMMLALDLSPIITKYTVQNIEREKIALEERRAALTNEQERAQREVGVAQERLTTLDQQLAAIEAEETLLKDIQV